jgi:ABC-type phosphate transport system permease subunit
MVAEFRGAPPHHLGTVELAMARAEGETIEVTLHIIDDWHRPIAQVVQVRMATAVARSLAQDLTDLIAETGVNSATKRTPPERA